MTTNYQQYKGTRNYPEVSTPDVRKKIAEELTSAREYHDMSLDQVSSVSKINTTYLQNLEEANWSFLPPVYVKLFIKAFAEVVGIQTEQFFTRLDEAFSSSTVRMQLIDSSEKFNLEGNLQPHARASSFVLWAERNRSILFFSIITVVIIGIIAIYLLRPPSQSEFQADIQPSSTQTQPDTVIVDTTIIESSEVISDTPLETEESVSGQEDSAIIPPAIEMFTPIFMFEDNCYIQIRHGNDTLCDKVYYPDNIYSEELPVPVRVVLGNAPATLIIVDSDTLPRFSDDKNVRVFNLGPDGFIE